MAAQRFYIAAWRVDDEMLVVVQQKYIRGDTHRIHGIHDKINGHFRILNWRYLPYIRPI
jgi:hypothetical protein